MRVHTPRRSRSSIVAVAAVLAAGALGLAAAPAAAAASAQPWPGGFAVTVVDEAGAFGEDLSGLSFQSPSTLWAVRNGPKAGSLFRLTRSDASKPFEPDRSDGTTLRYAGDDKGQPDAEGVVYSPDGLFVSIERDNRKSGQLDQILRYSVPGSSTPSTAYATGTWNLNSDVPGLPDNEGIEAIAWVPDSYLTAHGFRDEHTKATYNPASYKNHGSGLYFVGVEHTGQIIAYALSLNSPAYQRVATISSGFPGVMDLEWEPSAGRLWAACDDTCDGRLATLSVNGQGAFGVTAVYDPPSGMDTSYNNEGFAIAPSSACVNGVRPAVWSDDGNDQDHALRSATITCVS